MILNSPYITGSITVTGNANVQGTLTVTGSLSGTATSASLALNSNLLQGTGSVGFSTTASLLAVSSSQQQISSSLLNVIANYATTGSNSFRADQSITGSLVVSSTITAQTLVVQTVTSSIVYSSGSNLFGSALGDRQTFTGSLNVTGSTHSIFGNVGIGTNTPNYTTTGRTVIAVDGSTSALYALQNSGTSAGYIYGDASSVVLWGEGSRNLTIGVASAGTISLNTNNTSRLYITSGGNVGIGRTDPTRLLDVSALGAAYIRASDRTNSVNVDMLAASSGGWIGTQTTHAFMIQTDNTERMRITSGGNVGIGTTSPSQSLHIYGSSIRPQIEGTGNGGYSSLRFVGKNSGGTSRTFEVGLNITADDVWQVTNGTTPFLNVNTSGNVGIGSTSPARKLIIYGGTTNAGLEILSANGYRTAIIAGGASSGTGADQGYFQMTDQGTAKIVLNTAGDSYITGGNLGIGYSLPLAILSTYGGAVQFMGDYRNYQTIIKNAGATGTFNGSLLITIPQMSDGNVDGYGGYSCEVYVAGYSGFYCHAWFGGYINGGITSSEATILRSNGGWSISQASYGANNQGFQFTIDYPSSIVHPTARIIFNKGGSPNSAQYPANTITSAFS